MPVLIEVLTIVAASPPVTAKIEVGEIGIAESPLTSLV
jgi:hypothetical protein